MSRIREHVLPWKVSRPQSGTVDMHSTDSALMRCPRHDQPAWPEGEKDTWPIVLQEQMARRRVKVVPKLIYGIVCYGAPRLEYPKGLVAELALVYFNKRAGRLSGVQADYRGRRHGVSGYAGSLREFSVLFLLLQGYISSPARADSDHRIAMLTHGKRYIRLQQARRLR